MIELMHISKTFPAGRADVHAVRDVSLHIGEGEIFGIVGYSGAGKSTLVRCINLLERPTKGRVCVGGVDLTALSGAKLNRERKKIGMIFQQFNLFASRTVFENVAYPLRYTGRSRKEIKEKVESLLAFVELTDKRDVYPSQLSGGQKQRVAIARALACDPKVLLCDEATSALDPQTTSSILRLLKRLNEQLGITIVVITHQMQVVKEICSRVAVMEKGCVVEEGDVYSIFATPQAPITKSFIASAGNLSRVNALIEDGTEILKLRPGECVVKLLYQRESAVEALVSTVSRRYGVDVNIIFGNIELIGNDPLGELMVILSGAEADIESAIAYFKEKQVDVEVISRARIS